MSIMLSYPKDAPIAWDQMTPIAQRAAEQAALAVARACAAGDLARAEQVATAVRTLALGAPAQLAALLAENDRLASACEDATSDLDYIEAYAAVPAQTERIQALRRAMAAAVDGRLDRAAYAAERAASAESEAQP